MVAPAVKQTWAVMGVLLNMLGQGMVLAFPSILLPALLAPDSKIKADLDGASWAASCVAPAGIPGFFISSFLMDRIGRKFTHIIVMIPSIVGWVFIYFASNMSALIIGRILSGFTGAGTVILGAVVIGEFSSPANRGMFLNLKTTAVCLGNSMVHILGNYLTWNQIALVAMTPHLFALLIIFTWPESPAWLASKKKFEASEKSFYWLRGTSPESRGELEELIRAQKERDDQKKSMSILEKCLEIVNKFTKKDFVKPSIIMLFAGIILEACGRHFFAAYALQIIGEVTGSKTNSFYYTLAIDIIITTSAACSSVLVKVFKRRTLFFWSGFTALFILVCVCVYLFLSALGIISKDRPWIPIGLFVVYFILSNLGCTAIPLALLGELYPLAHRGVGAAVSGIILALTLMVTMQVTPYLLASVKVYGTFATYGAAMGLCLVGMYYILPETKDRTLQEIEYYFNFGKFRDDKIDNDEEAKMKMIPHTN
ncbi:facilitated trehalose transporter Tret1-like isoform X2 [Maniola hyperantus]|uniref:facilitated trehalose transporter Tret1-like isoform X2 n=1 Tax=Aphantopus hyperantus TaxID=2795564 RepID=UPI0015691D6E|nr:facilitated trehalose transporter Tret1-like [Maniola hyperantus]